jgi:transcriptional repressor NrdR
MKCPYCGADDDRVIDSRSTDAGKSIRRRRECNKCNKRFTTYEHVENTNRLVVIKKDTTRVPYDREKMLRGLQMACYKRPVTAEAMQKLIDEVEEELFRRFDREVESVEIGKLIAERLKGLDQVAYVRFASVYKHFRDLDDLLEEVRDVLQSTDQDRPEQGRLF